MPACVRHLSDTSRLRATHLPERVRHLSDTPSPTLRPMPPQTPLSTLLRRLTRTAAGDPTHPKRATTTRPHTPHVHTPDQHPHNPTGTPTGFHTPSYPDAHT